MVGSRIRVDVISAVWGFAEATVFFIVPDVWIGWVARHRLRDGIRASFSALLGAAAGGLVVRTISARLPARRTASVMKSIPAISERMIAEVDSEMAERGSRSMMSGPIRGVPYKLYARASGVQGTNILTFIMWTIPARLIRFLLAAIGFNVAAKVGAKQLRLSDSAGQRVYAGAWIAFYAWYFRKTARR